MSLPTEEEFKEVQKGLKRKSDALATGTVCSICDSPIEFCSDEGVWRHKGPLGEFFAQTFCDRYGYPVKPREPSI